MTKTDLAADVGVSAAAIGPDEARQTWRKAAQSTHAELVFVHLVTSNPHEHE